MGSHEYAYRFITEYKTQRKYYLYVWLMNEGENIEDVIDDIVLRALHNELIYNQPIENKRLYIKDCIRYASLAYKVDNELIVLSHRFRPEEPKIDREIVNRQMEELINESLDRLQMNNLSCLIPIVN